MKIKRYVRSFLLYIIIALLVVSIGLCTFAFVTVHKKTQEIANANSKIQATTEQLAQAREELQSQKIANSQVSEKLKTEQAKNKKLESQIAGYKEKIAELNAEIGAETDKSSASEKPSQPKYPKPTKVCYLTFDDGPSDNTLKILKILKKFDAKATFFVVGSAKLEYLPKIKNAGHAIGLHSNTHTYSKIYKSTNAFFKDLNKLSKKVENQIGEKVMLMRFPGGSNNTISKNYCKGIMTDLTAQVQEKGYTYFDWNVDSGDAAGRNVPAKRIINNVLNQAENKNSICVLMHDTDAKDTTVKALPKILDGLKKQGYKFEVLTDKTFDYHYKVNN